MQKCRCISADAIVLVHKCRCTSLTEEAVLFPWEFCHRVAALVIESADARVVESRVRDLRIKLATQRALNAAAAGRQHRKSPALLSGYKAVVHVSCSSDELDALQKWKLGSSAPRTLGTLTISPFHKLMAYQMKGGSDEPDGHGMTVKVGIMRTPVEFMHAAMKVTHPLITSSLGNADDLLIAIFRILTVGPTTIAKSRQLFIERLEKMADGLRQ